MMVSPESGGGAAAPSPLARMPMIITLFTSWQQLNHDMLYTFSCIISNISCECFSISLVIAACSSPAIFSSRFLISSSRRSLKYCSNYVHATHSILLTPWTDTTSLFVLQLVWGLVINMVLITHVGSGVHWRVWMRTVRPWLPFTVLGVPPLRWHREHDKSMGKVKDATTRNP